MQYNELVFIVVSATQRFREITIDKKSKNNIVIHKCLYFANGNAAQYNNAQKSNLPY